MNRDRRQLNQLLGTIQMKQAVLDNQKKNVYELLDELVEEITKKIENLVPRDGEHAADLDKARVLIQQLDKASDLFTKIVLDTDSYLCQLAEEPLKTENKKEEKVQQSNPCQLVTAVAMSSEKRATLQSPVDQKFLLSSEKRATLQSPVDQKFLLSSENRATLQSPVDQKFLLSSENRATLQSPVDGTFLLERNFFKPIKERTIKHSSTDKLNQQSSLDKIVLPSTVDKTISKPFQERASLNIPDRKLLKPAIDKTFVKPAIEKTTPQAYSDKPVLQSPVERKLLQLTVDRTAVNTELNTKLFSPLFVNTNCLESSREELSDNLVIIKETILGVDEILNVVVIDVEHPWSFHVQLINDLNVVIAKKIREHIISGKMTILEAHQGLYCLAKFEDNCYYRAKIKSVQGEMVSVKYVDYGNSHLVSVNDIFVLPPSLASYPANSIWCALEGVCPKNVERMWPEVAIQQFQQCICDQQVKIQRLSEKKEKWYDSLPWIIKVVFNKKHLDHIASKSTDTKAESLSKFLINIGLAQAIELHDLVQELKVFYSDDAGADCPDLQEHTEANICSLTPHSHKVDKKAENLMQRESNYELGLLVHEKLVQLCRTMKLPSNVHSGAVSRDDEEMTLPILLRSVISPDSFFVSYVGSHLQEMVKEIQTQLDVSYNNQPKSELLARKQSFSPPSVGSLCCAIFSEDSLFYRGLILAASNKTSQHGKSVIQFLVFFIDFGDFEWVPESNVFPLSDKLQKIKSAVLWCSLSNLKPPDPHKPWSSHVVDIFKAMMSSERTSHLVVSKSKLCALQDSTVGSILQSEPLPVFLVVEDQYGEELCVNLELIAMGLASLDRNGSPCLEPGENAGSPDVNVEWDPMTEDFNSLRNSYKVNVDDPGVALVGYSSSQADKATKKVCVYYNRRGGCHKGQQCSNMHIKVDDTGTMSDKVPVLLFEDNSHLIPEEGTHCLVMVVHVKSPVSFFVHVINSCCAEEESLKDLMERMKVFYGSSPFYDGDLTLLAPGQAVAACLDGIWLRGKVLDTDVENSVVQVMSVDYGNVHWVKENDIRELDLSFIHLTPQAVECGLMEIEPVEHESPAHVSEVFKTMALGKEFVAEVKNRSPSGHVYVCLESVEPPYEEVTQCLINAGLVKKKKKLSLPQTITKVIEKEKRSLTFLPG